jgi:polyisoprenoid-binding protein YceI
MGEDWYQVNGTMAIKGIEKNVKLFVTGNESNRGRASENSLRLKDQTKLLPVLWY